MIYEVVGTSGDFGVAASTARWRSYVLLVERGNLLRSCVGGLMADDHGQDVDGMAICQ